MGHVGAIIKGLAVDAVDHVPRHELAVSRSPGLGLDNIDVRSEWTRHDPQGARTARNRFSITNLHAGDLAVDDGNVTLAPFVGCHAVFLRKLGILGRRNPRKRPVGIGRERKRRKPGIVHESLVGLLGPVVAHELDGAVTAELDCRSVDPCGCRGKHAVRARGFKEIQ